MTRRYRFAVTALGLALAAATGVAQAQNYPTKPVTIICDSAAGSTPDVVTRFFAEGLGRRAAAGVARTWSRRAQPTSLGW